MPESGSNILSYRGDAGLGMGANAAIPVINKNNNLDVINNTSRDIMLLNHDNNIKLYDQKIKDRDTALNLLAQGEIASGKIDPNDRPYYDEAKKNMEKSFYDMINKGGINNQEAYKNYLDKAAQLKNVTDWAQGRQVELDKLSQEKSAQTLPEDIRAYDNHIQSQRKKDFWQPIDPYQKAFNYDLGASTANVTGQPITQGVLSQNIAPTGTTTWNSKTVKNGVETDKTTTKNAPLKTGLVTNKGTSPVTISGTSVNPDGSFSPYSYTPEKYYDFPTIQKNVAELAATNPTENYTYRSFFNDFQDPNKLPPLQQKSTIQAYNNRIADYSQQRGITPLSGQYNPDGSPMYPDQIKYHQNTDGSVIVQETPESFFAKHALASINGDYVQKPQAVLNEGAVKLNILKQRADADNFYKHAMAGAAQTKARAYADNLRQQMKYRKSGEEQDNFLNEIYNKNISQQPLLEGRGGTTASLANIDASKSLPVFTLDGNKPKQLIPIDGKPVYGANKQVMYYKGGHFEPIYYFQGKEMNVKDLNSLYQTFIKNQGKSWNGSFDDFLKGYINNNLFEVKLKGANGSTDAQLSLAAQRIISNQTTKKGQTGAFDNNEQPPLDESGVSDNQNDNQ